MIHITDSFITNVELDRMDLNLQGIPLTGNLQCKVEIFQHMMTGLDGPRNEIFYLFAKFFTSLVKLSGVKAGLYLQSSHVFTYQNRREFYLSAHFNTFILREAESSREEGVAM